MNCPNCATPLPEDAQVCVACGTPIAPSPLEAEPLQAAPEAAPEPEPQETPATGEQPEAPQTPSWQEAPTQPIPQVSQADATAPPFSIAAPTPGTPPPARGKGCAVFAILIVALFVAAAGAGAAYWFLLKPASALPGDWGNVAGSGPLSASQPAYAEAFEVHIDRVDLTGNISGTLKLPEGSAPLTGRALGSSVSFQSEVPSPSGPAQKFAFTGTLDNGKLDGTIASNVGVHGPTPTTMWSTSLARNENVAAVASPSPTASAAPAESEAPQQSEAPSAQPSQAAAAEQTNAPTQAPAPAETPQPSPAATHAAAVATTRPPATKAPATATPVRTAPPASLVHKPAPKATQAPASAPATISATMQPLHRWACALDKVGLSSSQQQQIQSLFSNFEQVHATEPVLPRHVRALRQQVEGILTSSQLDDFQTRVAGHPCLNFND